MVFSSLSFLFLFLPVFLLVYWASPPSWRNAALLIGSLLFYAWGEGSRVVLVIIFILCNWLYGLGLGAAKLGSGRRRALMAVAVIFDIGFLAYFKYLSFLISNLDQVMPAGWRLLPVPEITLLLGISFITFHALSYLIDVYRGTVNAQRRLTEFGIYMAMFPQLIAGPIIRYHDIYKQLSRRNIDTDGIAAGCGRFAIGLAKKVLIANQVGPLADQIFNAPVSWLSIGPAWAGVIAYTLQIYFDFSGYSDMAIGLGRMLGFKFPENFNYPYISRSVQEFWRRWHITLSRWFRNYLYIPLGGNRDGTANTYRNLVIVFLLCGFWHGAAWTFIIWGGIHGAFLVIERAGFAEVLNRLPRFIQHAYTLMAVMLAWIFFRADTANHAFGILKALVGLGQGDPRMLPLPMLLDRGTLLALCLGIIGSMPIPLAALHDEDWLQQRAMLNGRGTSSTVVTAGIGFYSRWGKVAFNTLMLIVSACYLVAGTFNPFIYFRF